MAEEAQTGNSGAGPRGFVGASSHGGEGERLRRTKCTVRGTRAYRISVGFRRSYQNRTKPGELHQAEEGRTTRIAAIHCQYPSPPSIRTGRSEKPIGERQSESSSSYKGDHSSCCLTAD